MTHDLTITHQGFISKNVTFIYKNEKSTEIDVYEYDTVFKFMKNAVDWVECENLLGLVF